ncbi:MAG TPA: hypothetical protein PKC24_02230 [Cyclobacteriaceae bacterium]|nr:hypothetical protein [Cyclobacteriaceae bacterium]
MLKPLRQITLFIIALSFLSLDFPAGREISWLVEPGSRLIIDGKSNVNKFRCAVEQYPGLDTLRIIYNEHTSDFIALNGAIQVHANSFDCKNDMMTSDLRKTILADQFPHLRVEFLPTDARRPDTTKPGKAIIQISLGGVCKEFTLDYHIERSANGKAVLKGSRKFLFSDFHLEPPTKLMGMVKVDNEFEVIFDLVLKPLV